jgi:hypothetical protein
MHSLKFFSLMGRKARLKTRKWCWLWREITAVIDSSSNRKVSGGASEGQRKGGAREGKGSREREWSSTRSAGGCDKDGTEDAIHVWWRGNAMFCIALRRLRHHAKLKCQYPHRGHHTRWGGWQNPTGLLWKVNREIILSNANSLLGTHEVLCYVWSKKYMQFIKVLRILWDSVLVVKCVLRGRNKLQSWYHIILSCSSTNESFVCQALHSPSVIWLGLQKLTFVIMTFLHGNQMAG